MKVNERRMTCRVDASLYGEPKSITVMLISESADL